MSESSKDDIFRNQMIQKTTLLRSRSFRRQYRSIQHHLEGNNVQIQIIQGCHCSDADDKICSVSDPSEDDIVQIQINEKIVPGHLK